MRGLLNIWAGVLIVTLVAMYLVGTLKAAIADGDAAAAGAPATDVAGAQQASDDGGQVDSLTPDAGNLRAFVNLARSDIRLQKSLIIAQNLPLTEEEAAEFWPIHREYEQELAKLNDRRIVLIKKYLPTGGSITNAEARQVAGEVFDIEASRTALKKEYFGKFQKATSDVTAARFFQIENQLNMVLELRIAASLPLIK
jgi:hypothetical protein